MKKKDILKIAAIVLVPGTIPLWIGYKVYEQIKKSKEKNNEQPEVSTDTQNGS